MKEKKEETAWVGCECLYVLCATMEFTRTNDDIDDDDEL